MAVITVLRLIPFVRMGTTLGTGLLGIRLRDFVIGAGISAVIWTALPLSIGYAFRHNVTTIEGMTKASSMCFPRLSALPP